MAKFQLRFPTRDISYWAERYEYDETPILPIVSEVKRRGFLTKKDFLTACRWKTARSQSRCRENSSEFICAVTNCALSTPVEQLRIEVLTLLNGVSWPHSFGDPSFLPLGSLSNYGCSRALVPEDCSSGAI